MVLLYSIVSNDTVYLIFPVLQFSGSISPSEGSGPPAQGQMSSPAPENPSVLLTGYQRVKREHFQGVCLLINTVNSFPFTNINSWQSVTKKERGKKKNLNPTLVKSLPLPIFFFQVKTQGNSKQ